MTRQFNKPTDDIGFQYDTMDHKRDETIDSLGTRNRDAEFQQFTRCLIPDPNLQEWFLLLPTALLESNLKHADTRQVAYWAARALKVRGVNVAVNKFVCGPNVFRFEEKLTERHLADRKQLLILGACRALIQRCHEIDGVGDHYGDGSRRDMTQWFFQKDMWEMSSEEIKTAHQQFDSEGLTKTNCPNYFKQFWPGLHMEVFCD